MRKFASPGARAWFVLAMACVGIPSISAAQGQFSQAGCDDVAESQFKYVPVVGKAASTQAKALAIDNTLNEPIHMALDAQPGNKVDIYFTERSGNVKKFSAADNTVTTIGKVTTTNTGELGLTGIALDPGFKTNHWMYLFYATPAILKLSRFTLNNGQLDNSTEKTLLSYRHVVSMHMGGALAFDSNGDLYVTSGNDGSDYPGAYNENTEGGSSEGSSGNMNDLRGGAMRIHPDNSAKGYTIPKGNFGPYMSALFKAKGNADLAATYADSNQVKPELYVKGTRNAYSVAVDTMRHWMAFGNIGINVTTSMSETHHMLTHPAFVGYPYFTGGFGQDPGTGFYALWAGAGATNFSNAHPGLTEDISGPVNLSKWNTGPKQLPPVTPAMHTYLRGSGAMAVTGPFYHYNGASTSAIKFPPHFDGAWIVTDWVQNNRGGGFQGIIAYKFNAEGTIKTDSLKLFQSAGLTGPIDMQAGPDGALYVINYGSTYFGTTNETKIARFEYTGTCRPTVALRAPGGTRSVAQGSAFRIDLPGRFDVSVRDLQGREVARLADQAGSRSYRLRDMLPASTPRGVLTVTASGPGGSQSFRVLND